MSMIQFVANYDDLSTDKGYQFRFHCDKCGNGFMSHYEANALGTAAELLNAASNIFGGFLGSAGNTAYGIQRAVGGQQHDSALEKAVQEGKEHFKQCTRCGRWVCPEVCWNANVGLCEGCAPDDTEELAAQQALATSEQIYTKTREQNYTQAVNFAERANISACTHCGAQMASATKFCAECGQPNVSATAQAKHCTECGAKISIGAKFCPDCGNKA